jgi:allantoinase
LWNALRDGILTQVVTDHSPADPALKCVESGDFVAAWGGIASLQLGLRATWTEAHARGMRLSQLVEWMCAAPARLVGLSHKGRIEVGADADLVVFDPDATERVEARRLFHRHAVTPYDGRELRGRVVSTWLRGRQVAENGQLLDRPAGALLSAEVS